VKSTAKELARHFDNLDAIMDATEEQLLEVQRCRPYRRARAFAPSLNSRTTAKWSSNCVPAA
jgi:NAD-dependent DNA ligase